MEKPPSSFLSHLYSPNRYDRQDYEAGKTKQPEGPLGIQERYAGGYDRTYPGETTGLWKSLLLAGFFPITAFYGRIECGCPLCDAP